VQKKKIYVAGHQGMVGSALVKCLSARVDLELCTSTRQEVDLCDYEKVVNWFDENRPEEVYLAAAKVGGISANNRFPADFILDNLMIQNNVIKAALDSGVKKLLLLGSSCIYPKFAEQPIKEEFLLTGSLEPTNEPYAISKIAGIKLCESLNRQFGVDYRAVMPTNLYGANDNFHPENSHVIPAMMRRFHLAKLEGSKKVTVWGSGAPRREFMLSDDMAAACVHVMNSDQERFSKIAANSMCAHINIGTGVDHSIRELAEIMADVTGFRGSIVFDTSKPDGTPRKLLSVERLSQLGWDNSTELIEGLASTYEWFQRNVSSLRGIETTAR